MARVGEIMTCSYRVISDMALDFFRLGMSKGLPEGLPVAWHALIV